MNYGGCVLSVLCLEISPNRDLHPTRLWCHLRGSRVPRMAAPHSRQTERALQQRGELATSQQGGARSCEVQPQAQTTNEETDAFCATHKEPAG